MNKTYNTSKYFNTSNTSTTTEYMVWLNTQPKKLVLYPGSKLVDFDKRNTKFASE